MKPFLDDDFLLETPTAVELYHEHAKLQPIIDYHCHLSAEQIADDHRFETLTEIWLDGDHYKWRAMRANGIDERLITGDAGPWEKFEAWARTVPKTLRNPLYHWTHLELKFPFGIRDKLLGPDTAREIYEQSTARLAEDGFTTQGLLRQYGVLVVCSTDDPTDSLEPHRRHAEKPHASTRLLPTFRPDRAFMVDDVSAFNQWIDRLSEVARIDIGTFATLVEALEKRHDYFHTAGCRSSDHGLERMYAAPYTENELDAALSKARAGRQPSEHEIEQFRSALLYELAKLNHRRGWTQQFHLGAIRNVSRRARQRLGPDTGYDAISDFPQATSLVRFLDRLDESDQLAKTIVYNLNPADNEVFATILGCFQDGRVPGKLQFGSAWWFLDQKDGIERQLEALSNMGLVARFVGMLTDSRSFLSYSRHEYFRRLFCNLIGHDVEKGLLPHDRGLLGNLVRDVCFRNAREYFQFA